MGTLDEGDGSGARRNEVSCLLEALRVGETGARERLVPVVYRELHELAHRRLEGLPRGATLQTTVLVHEAWMRLEGGDDWQSRAHFFGAAARAMRNVLVDRARARGRIKRGSGAAAASLDESAALEPAAVDGQPSLDVLALDEALERLAQLDAVKAEVVMLRHFAGLSVADTARALDLSPATIDRHWSFARAWLRREMSPPED